MTFNIGEKVSVPPSVRPYAGSDIVRILPTTSANPIRNKISKSESQRVHEIRSESEKSGEIRSESENLHAFYLVENAIKYKIEPEPEFGQRMSSYSRLSTFD